MRLLIITQKIDRADPVLGFFHRWVEEFSKGLESAVVVCLQRGDYSLPGTVSVLSLGKEKRESRLKYIFLLFYFSIRYHNRYDAVLVHMNQEYILTAGWLWKLLGKRIYMWRNHYSGSMLTDIAAAFCTKIFCTSHYSYTARFKQVRFMPVGIDTERFKPDPSVRRIPHSILSLGRIAQSKNIHTFIEALKIMKGKGAEKGAGASFTAGITGNPAHGDEPYLASLKEQAASAGLSDPIAFIPGIANTDTPALYSAYQAFVNLSPNGMYDKTIFEAMACGCFVFASNDDLRGKNDPAFAFAYNDPTDLAAKLSAFMAMNESEQKAKAAKLAGIVQDHSLARLSEELIREMNCEAH